MAHTVRVGRNDACSCGSGKKSKKCCAARQRSDGSLLMIVLISVVVLGGLFTVVRQFTSETAHVGRSSGVWSAEHGHYH